VTPDTKIDDVDFRRIKSKNTIRDLTLFKLDRNKLILMGAAKWPYPPYSFIKKSSISILSLFVAWTFIFKSYL